jgi:peptidoglycan hydrolase-like protein with peptidoglycan-binding domain
MVLRKIMGLMAVILALGAGPQGALAQSETAWIQLQALPDLPSAQDSARSFELGLGEAVAGFALGSRWYVVVIGPYVPSAAAGKMAALKSAGRIPRDAYITDGSDYGAPFWPNDNAAALPVPFADAAPDLAPPPNLAAPVDDETPAEASRRESQLPRADKVALQSALQWYGHYAGSLDGAFGAGTRKAMAAWQGAMGFAQTGVLSSLQRGLLMQSYQTDQASFDFQIIQDPEAGLEIALPTAWLEFDRYDPPFVRYRAQDALGAQLWLVSEPGDTATLAGLYDQLQSLAVIPPQGPRQLDASSFTIMGENDLGGAFAMADARKGTIKGFVLIWPAAQSEMAKRAIEVMRSSVRSISDQVLDPGLVPLDEALRQNVIDAMQIAQPKTVLSGAYIAPSGLVLTALEGVASCGRITVDGATQAVLVNRDDPLGVAILRPLSAVSPLAVAAFSNAPQGVGDVLIAGYSLPSGLPAPVLTQAKIIAETGPSLEPGVMLLSADVTAHDLGGPVLDIKTGALIGLMRGTQSGAKILPQGTALAQTDLGAFLALALGSAATPAQFAPITPQALYDHAMGITVQVACWP